MTPSVPPRFVPTLTDIVQSPVLVTPSADEKSAEPLRPDALVMEEEIIHRVMQRVDLMLDRRLREALGQVILAHTQNLAPLLREEIELVVRESVSQALTQELL